MKFSDFILRDAIRPPLSAKDRDGVLRELVESLAGAGAVPREIVEELVLALVKRERTGSTGFGRGVAVPHVKHPQIKKLAGTIGCSVEGVDFAALDKQPVYTVVLLLSPENQPEQHLAAMNIIFTSLQDDMFRRFMRQAQNKQAILDILDEADAGK